MDLSKRKHNIIVYHENKLQLWDTDTKKPLVTYDFTAYTFNMGQLQNNIIRSNNEIIMYALNVSNEIYIYDIFSGRLINKIQGASDFNICDTHMAIWYYSKKTIEITDLNTMKTVSFRDDADYVIDLVELCVNSNFVAGIEPRYKRIKIIDHTIKHPVMCNDIHYINGPHATDKLIMNKTHLFCMSKYVDRYKIDIVPLNTMKFKHGIYIDGLCGGRFHLNPINDTVYVTTWLSVSIIKVITLDPELMNTTSVVLKTANIAIGSAIAYIQTNLEDTSDTTTCARDLNIQCGNKILVKPWDKIQHKNTYDKSFNIMKVVLDYRLYFTERLKKYIVPDLVDIIMSYC